MSEENDLRDKLERLRAQVEEEINMVPGARESIQWTLAYSEDGVESIEHAYFLAARFTQEGRIEELKGLKRHCLGALSAFMVLDSTIAEAPTVHIAQWREVIEHIDWTLGVLESTTEEQASKAVAASPIQWNGRETLLKSLLDVLENEGLIAHVSYLKIERHFVNKHGKPIGNLAKYVSEQSGSAQAKKDKEARDLLNKAKSDERG